MDEHIVRKEHMESLKALSDVNIKISEAQNELFKLQESETEYLVTREKKAMDRIQKVVDDSQELIKEADKNHGQIKELLTGVSQFAEKLIKAQIDFHDLLAEFEEQNVEWEKKIGKQQDDLAEINKQQKVVQVQIENDKKSLEVAKNKLQDDQRKLDSDRGTVERTIKRIKQGKI